jgi:hypothetical protein
MSSKYKISPSASSRFLTCTASLPYNTEFHENVHTLKGNLQHEVAQLRLEQIIFDKDNDKKIQKLTTEPYKSRKTQGLSVKWDRSCEDTVDNYITYIKNLIKQFKPKKIFLEYRIKMTFYGNKINGVVDFAMILPEDDIFIVDLKTGRSHVDADDNSQMLMYGYGMAQNIFRETNKLPNKVIISIAQSILNNTSAVSYTFEQLVNWYIAQAKPMKEINTNKLVFRPSVQACKYCQRREECTERIDAGVYFKFPK